MGDRESEKKVYRYAPVPSYDIEGMESWLADMAEDGLHLDEDGCFGGLTTFCKGTPAKVRYRLQAAKKSTSMWADNNGDPEEEDLEISEKYGWKYVAKRGAFHIYRTEEPGVRELNTDPEVQALALKEVQKRCCSTQFYFFFWVGIDLLFAIYGNLIRIMVYMGLGMFLFGAGLLLWMALDYLAESLHLRKLRKKLKLEGYLDHEKDWRRKVRFYYGRKIAKPLLMLLFAVLFLRQWGDELLGEDVISLAEYEAEVPFATIEDFAEGEYERQLAGLDWTNHVREWNYWIAPVNFEWRENARVTRTDGTFVEGGLDVDYHEVRFEWLASPMAKEYMRKMKLEKNYKPLEAEIYGVDYYEVFLDEVHFPAAVLQKGNQVIFAQFYQVSDSSDLTLQQWIQTLADSMKGK